MCNNNITMGLTGELTKEEITEILSILPAVSFNTFVELGTYMGHSTLNMAHEFERVHTIEIIPELYQQAIKYCSKVDNISFHLGDTVQLLPLLVNDLKDKSCVYMVDSHQSGPETGNNGKWVPLLDEIDIICSKIDVDIPQILVIDDVRLFGMHWDWADVSISSIDRVIRAHNVEIMNRLLKNDRYTIACVKKM